MRVDTHSGRACRTTEGARAIPEGKTGIIQINHKVRLLQKTNRKTCESEWLWEAGDACVYGTKLRRPAHAQQLAHPRGLQAALGPRALPCCVYGTWGVKNNLRKATLSSPNSYSWDY